MTKKEDQIIKNAVILEPGETWPNGDRISEDIDMQEMVDNLKPNPVRGSEIEVTSAELTVKNQGPPIDPHAFYDACANCGYESPKTISFSLQADSPRPPDSVGDPEMPVTKPCTMPIKDTAKQISEEMMLEVKAIRKSTNSRSEYNLRHFETATLLERWAQRILEL